MQYHDANFSLLQELLGGNAMNKKAVKTVIVTICVLLLLWLAIGVVDLFRVKSFEKPLFTLKAETADDGGSGMYYGLRYSFEIKGNFMPEDELPGVTQYKYYIFNNLVLEGIRD
jgi:hypothetical protein